MPVTIDDAAYAALNQDDTVTIANIHAAVKGAGELVITTAKGQQLKGEVRLSQREAAILLAGGLLNFIKNSVEA